MAKYFESIFDVFYLILVISLGFSILSKARSKDLRLFGFMALILGFDDSFHLIPRIIALNSDGLDKFLVPLGFGKMVTSITMTIFYLILYLV